MIPFFQVALNFQWLLSSCSPIDNGMLRGPVLCKCCSCNLSCGKFMRTMAVTCPDDRVSQLSSATFGSYILSTVSSMKYQEPCRSRYRCSRDNGAVIYSQCLPVMKLCINFCLPQREAALTQAASSTNPCLYTQLFMSKFDRTSI